MQDKLLLLVGDWFAIKAEGATAILAACLISGYFGLLATLVFIARSRRSTITEQKRSGSDSTLSTLNVDQLT